MYPILYHIGSFPIGTYGVLIAVGLLMGLMVAMWRAGTVGLEKDIIVDLAFFGILAGIVGSRIGYILLNYKAFTENPRSYILAREGFVFAGGLVLALVIAGVFLYMKKQNVWRVMDVVAPSISLGHVFGRVGCFFSGCCYGKVSWLPWAVRFPRGSAVFLHQVEEGMIDNSDVFSHAVHPTQIYAAIGNLIVFLILTFLWGRRIFKGQIFLAYVVLYSVSRFMVEFFRGDKKPIILELFTATQLACAIGFITAIVIYLIVRNERSHNI